MAVTPRGNVNTQGVTPLANTGSGAAGTVLGTERASLQTFMAGVWSGVSLTLSGAFSAGSASIGGALSVGGTLTGNAINATAITGSIIGSTGNVNGKQFTVGGAGAGAGNLVTIVPGADSPSTIEVYGTNAANTVALWSITQDGHFSGIAANASALLSGTTDGDKLHDLGHVYGVVVAGTPAITTSMATYASLALPAGKYVVSGHALLQAGNNGATPVNVTMGIYDSSAGVYQDESADAVVSLFNATLSSGAILVTGPTTISLNLVRGAGTCIVIGTGPVTGGAASYIRAMRIG